MATTKFQPTIAAPTTPPNQVELNFIEDLPPGLFVENPNSNMGVLRRTFTDQMQEVVDQLALLYAERFVATATATLDQWEEEVGLPIEPSGKTTAQRRASILGRLKTGPFTRARRAAIIDASITATFGQTIALIAAGVPFDAGGLGLFSDITSTVGLYTITENVSNFSFNIDFATGTTVDEVSIRRDMDAILPAGINYTITYNGTPPATTRAYGDGTYGSGTYGG